ncbi:MAG: hypothetical protein K2V38_04600 [Gemmataceae bacterium]|nr:hypothetical protein [Gemmataceae bacterium]
MPEFGMTTPMGEVVYHSDAGWLREMMLHAGPEFWNVGGGDAGVEYHRTRLTLIFNDLHGFYISYRDPNEDTSYIPWMLDNYGRSVQVSTGGQPFYLPEAMFLSRELAYAVVEEFCRTGQRSAKIRWLEATKVSWNAEAGKPLNL